MALRMGLRLKNYPTQLDLSGFQSGQIRFSFGGIIIQVTSKSCDEFPLPFPL